MATVESLCDHVTILDHGQVVAYGHMDDITAQGTLEDAFVRAVGAENLDGAALSWLGGPSIQDSSPQPPPPSAPTSVGSTPAAAAETAASDLLSPDADDG